MFKQKNISPLEKDIARTIKRARDDGYVAAHNDFKKFYKGNRYLVVVEFNEDGGFEFKTPQVCYPFSVVYENGPSVGLETVRSQRADEANERIVAHLYDVFVETENERLAKESEERFQKHNAIRSDYV